MTKDIKTPEERRRDYINYLLGKLLLKLRAHRPGLELIEYCESRAAGLYWNPTSGQYEVH